MRAELYFLLKKISEDRITTHGPFYESPEQKNAALKNEVKSVDDAKDALVWLMRCARYPGYEVSLPFFCELLSELFTLYPSLVNAKLSFAENIKDLSKIEILPLDNQLPHTEGEYYINVRSNPYDTTLIRCRYRNYALCTPFQFATIYDLEPIKALLEANPKFSKIIEVKEDEYPLNSINYYKRQNSLASKVRECLGPDDSSAHCNLPCSDIEAEEILVELLEKARHNPKEDENYAKIINELIKKHPQMNLNILSNHLGVPPHSPIYKLFPCSPVDIASLYNLKAILEVLLSQPTINLTVNAFYGHVENNDTKRILRKAAIKQFYREALAISPNEKDRLVKKFHDFELKPKDLSNYIQKEIFPEIMGLLETIDDIQDKIEFIDAKKVSLFKPSALTEFLGSERKASEKIFDDKFQDLIKSNAFSATSQEGVETRYQQAMDELKKDNTPEKSRTLLHSILHDLVDDRNLEEVAINAISELMKICPDLDLNKTDFVYDDRLVDPSEYRSLFINKGWQNLPVFRGLEFWKFSEINPLMVASVLSCQNLIKFLLKQPNIDITIRAVVGEQNYCYFRLKKFAFMLAPDNACRKILYQAAYRLVYGELLRADPGIDISAFKRKLSIVFWMLPSDLADNIKQDILEQVNEKTSDEEKLQVLKDEYLKFADDNSALAKYFEFEAKDFLFGRSELLDLRKFVKDMMIAILKNQKTPAASTAAPTVSSRSINDDNSKPDEAGPSSGLGAKLSRFFYKK